VKDLVEAFEADLAYYTSAEYGEVAAREHFINRLFEALGWDVTDRSLAGRHRDVVMEQRHEAYDSVAGVEEWDEDLSAEELASRDPASSFPDYVFRIENHPQFVVEAKRPGVNIRLRPPVFQLKSYAWSLKTRVGILTNFHRFRVFDAARRPEYDRPEAGIVEGLDLSFRELPEAWDRLWSTLSREAVEAGSLQEIAGGHRRRTRGTLPVDRAFLQELDEWRERLATDLLANNPDLDRWSLSEATQRILDRIVFIRVCEDRQIEVEPILRRYARVTDAYRKATTEFRRLDAIYNGQLFREHFSERLHVSDGLFQRLVESLYYPFSPYRFDAFGPELLGAIYERFLGRQIEISEDRQVSVEDKPEVRHAGGVYYTPQWVVEHIVREAVAPVVEDKTPRAVANVRILDPACGSGAFLLGAFDYLIKWHEGYYTDHPTESPTSHFEDRDGNRRLTSDAKATILANNLYGVDIDPAAAEVTQLSLYLKLLEGENLNTLAMQPRLFETGYLPPLDKNIREGNSLLESDDLAADVLFDFELNRRVNPFDWHDEAHGFGAVFDKRGGFDAVIGNPPYTRVQELRRYRPEETTAYSAKFDAASSGSFDIAALFIEQGLGLLRSARSESGTLAMIVTRQFAETDAGRPVRRMLSERQGVRHIIDFGAGLAFEGVGAYTLILVAGARRHREHRLTRVPAPPSGSAMQQAIKDPTLSAERPASSLTSEEWDLLLPTEEKLLERLDQAHPSLRDVSGNTVFQGVVTGADYVYRLRDHGPDPDRAGCHLVSRRDVHETDARPEPIEEQLLRRVYAGRSDIQRFYTRPASEVLLLPYDREGAQEPYRLMSPSRLVESFPHAWSWLQQHRDVLEARAGDWNDLNWFAYSRRQNLELFAGPKVLVPYMVSDLCAVVDHDAHYLVNVSTGGYGIPANQLADTEFIAALLSSQLLSWVLRRRSRAWRGEWFAARKGNLVRVPIAEPEPNRRESIKEGFERCVRATKAIEAAITDSDQVRAERLQARSIGEFDQAVFDLYGLTNKERRLVTEAEQCKGEPVGR
jgi:type I restriction-modification system DNA methylase subunit